MSHIPFAIAAYLLNSISVTINKLILVRSIKDPLVYIFYISLVSLIVILALPFTKIPSLLTFFLASESTILWTAGLYFMFKALQRGQVQRVIPSIGTLTPVILLMIASLSKTISINQTWAVGFLLMGLIFLTLSDWRGKFSLWELVHSAVSAILFALSYLILRQAYLAEDFLTVLVWSRLILIPFLAIILIYPLFRRKIFTHPAVTLTFTNKLGLLFVLGQLTGGASELLLTFSISLANPALVNSLQGTQYIFLLIFALVLGKKYPQIFKRDSALMLASKLIGIMLVGIGLYILTIKIDQTPRLGVSFSPRYAQSLNLDPKNTYLQLLNELKVERVRLPLYWDEVEINPHQLNFSSLDFYLDKALEAGAEVVLVVGQKQPRWPECFAPPWFNNLDLGEKESSILNLLQQEVAYFKHFPNIIYWQVENEPLLNYGLCDRRLQNMEFLKKEIDLVRGLDQRPILITDSGELSLWIDTIKLSDVFGTTLYRTVWAPNLGLIEYPIPPIFYPIKESLARFISKNHQDLTIISELQAEPWLSGGAGVQTVEPQLQLRQFPPSKLKDNFEYALQTNFSQIYFWGAEWWYFMAKNGHPEYLEYAKKLFSY